MIWYFFHCLISLMFIKSGLSYGYSFLHLQKRLHYLKKWMHCTQMVCCGTEACSVHVDTLPFITQKRTLDEGTIFGRTPTKRFKPFYTRLFFNWNEIGESKFFTLVATRIIVSFLFLYDVIFIAGINISHVGVYIDL